MRKLNVLLIALFIVAASASSQELGVRFGKATGGNFAIDGVFALGEFSRIHGDVSFGNNGVGIDLLWDFLYRPIGDAGFSWYAGAGPFFYLQDPFGFGVAGEIGVDYHFKDAPISLSADWRPSFLIVNTTHFSGDIFGFNVRYVFSK